MSRVKLLKPHLKVVQQNFNLLDADKDEKLNKKEASLLFRSLGQTISNRELQKIIDASFPVPQPTISATPHSAEQAGTIINDSTQKSAPSSIPSKALPGNEKAPVKTTKTLPSNAKASNEDNQVESLIDFNSFIRMFEGNYKQPLQSNVLIEGLQLFDPERTGQISLSQLRNILSSSNGEPLLGEDLEDIMELAMSISLSQSKDSGIDYVAFATKLCHGCGVQTL